MLLLPVVFSAAHRSPLIIHRRSKASKGGEKR